MYIDKVISKFYFNKVYTLNSSIKHMAFEKQKTDREMSTFKKIQYQAMTEFFMSYIVKTRPYIVFATSIIKFFCIELKT